MTVKLRLKEIREQRNLTQTELAERMGISKQALNRLESRAAKNELKHIGLHTIDSLCKCLGALPYELLEYRPDFEEPQK